MMTWILGKIVELLESGETNWRTEKCGRKTLNNSAKSASEIPPLYQGCSREKAIQEAIDLQEKGLDACVGINALSALTSGFLGLPGVALLYGVRVYLMG